MSGIGAKFFADRGLKIVHSSAIIAIIFCISGCGAIGDYSRDALNDNREADRTNNQVLLLNILRAKDRRPVELTSLRGDTMQSTLSGQVSLAAPLRQFNGNGLVATPQITASHQPSVANDILDTQEFYLGFLAPMPEKTLDLYMNEAFPLALLYNLLIDKFTITQGDRSFVATNNLGDPGDGERGIESRHGDFGKVVEALFDAGLVTESVSEAKNFGPSLSKVQMAQNLKDIAAVTSSGYSLSQDGNSYQLQKSNSTYRFCLQIPPGKVGLEAAMPYPTLFTIATGLRCGADSDERKAADDAVAKVDKPQSAKAATSPSKKTSSAVTALTLADLRSSPETNKTDCELFEMDLSKRKNTNNYQPTYSDKLLDQYCGLEIMLKGVSGLGAAGSVAIRMTTRSTEGVLYYLGEVSRWDLEKTALLIPMETTAAGAGEQPCGNAWAIGDVTYRLAGRYACRPLLVIEPAGGVGSEFIRVTYNGSDYSVPGDRQRAGLSTQVFELFHQLFALNKSGKDLPSTTILTVSGVP